MPLGLPSPHPLLTQHFDSPEVAFSLIDKEITILQNTIQALHAFRNTFTPIYRLPPELLTRIFGFIRPVPTKDSRDLYYRRELPLSWTVITRVSQHWRDVAISSPGLWTHLSSGYPKRVFQEWVKRSKAAPLSLDLNHISQDHADLVEKSLFRIREMNLHLQSTSWSTLAPQLSLAAPILESFSLTVLDRTNPVSGISDTTFGGEVPRLRRLELYGCSVDITAALFTDLTVLKLRNPPQKVSATELLTAISNFPGLTTLNLADMLHEGAPPVSSGVDVIKLPSLESLIITGQSLPQDLDILSHLNFPVTTCLDFSTHTRTGTAQSSLTEFLQIHKSSRQSAPSPTALTQPLHLSLQAGWNSFRMGIGADPMERIDRESFLTKPDLIQFEIIGPWEDNFELTDDAEFISLFATLPLSNVVAIGVNCDTSVGTWVGVFGRVASLKKISTTGERAGRVLEAIVDDFRERCPPEYGVKVEERVEGGSSSSRGGNARGKGRGRGGRSTKRGGKAGTSQNGQASAASGSGSGSSSSSTVVTWDPIFPNLENLNIQESTFPEKKIMDDLIRALRARKRVNKGLEVFEIMECGNVEPFVDPLHEVVGRVLWDGWTGTSDEDEDGDGDGGMDMEGMDEGVYDEEYFGAGEDFDFDWGGNMGAVGEFGLGFYEVFY